MATNGDNAAALAALQLSRADLEADPCMADCCLRDLQQQRAAAKLREQLLVSDPSSQRQKRQQAAEPALLPSGGALQAHAVHSSDQPSTLEHQDDGLLTEDSEEAALRDIRVRRLQELQRQAHDTASARRAGYGELSDVPEAKLLARVQGVQGCCVVHLAVAGLPACDELDQQLAGLAHAWQGTLFLRCVPRRASSLRAALGVPSLPALVCTVDGAVIGRAPLEQFGLASGDILEELVVAYLKRLRCLRVSRALDGAKEPGGGGVSSDEETSLDGDGCGKEGAPCEICGRRYPHQHVRPVYARDADLDSSDADSDGDCL